MAPSKTEQVFLQQRPRLHLAYGISEARQIAANSIIEQFARKSREQTRLYSPEYTRLPARRSIYRALARGKLALSSGTKSHCFESNFSRPKSKQLLSFFRSVRRVRRNDPQTRKGRGKPTPDLYLLALQKLNSTIDTSQNPILPSECLVFEDSVVGVEAARRAWMRVIWVPHPDVAHEYQEREKDILAGRLGLVDIGDDWQLGEIDDGWAEQISSLEHFDPQKYGISMPS